MDYKEQTRQLYDMYAEKFGKLTRDYSRKFIQKELDLFAESLKGKKILDLGSGGGRDSLIFKEKGLDPVCADISPKMIEICRKRGLKAEIMDMEDIGFEKATFDGVWAHASLLHVPKKKIKPVLKRIAEILKKEGILLACIKEGDFEGMQGDSRYPGHERYNAYYKQGEFRELLENYFDVFHTSKMSTGDERIFLYYICRVK